MKKINYIALDVHKKNIVMAESREPGKSEFTGEFLNLDSGIKKLIKKLKKLSQEFEIKICYEAGPCGFAVKRILHKHGFSCEIVAPSLIPTKSGDRIKTDKRDAKKLARLYRANELTFIAVPNEEQEAVRDFVRCREDLMMDVKKAKQRCTHFLIRHGYHYEGTNWTKGHAEWIKKIKFSDKMLELTLNQYINEIEYLSIQLDEMDQKIKEIASTKEYIIKVNALSAFKGIDTLSSMVIISEIFEFSRFSDPRDLMAYLGLVPCEYSSGGKQTKGSITKTGNKRARRMLIEAAHNMRHKPIITKTMKENLAKIEPDLRVIPVKALKRLNKRYLHLLFENKPTQVVSVAVAREMVGFIWHIMLLVEGKLSDEKIDLNLPEAS